MNQSQRFSENWQKVLLTNPRWDESVTQPHQQEARHIYLDREKQRKQKKLENLARGSGLFFFYRGDCPYSQAFSKTVANLSQRFHWQVVAISLDGGSLEAFPHFKQNNGIAQNLNIQTVPSLWAVDPHSKSVLPLTHKMVSETELVDQIDLLTTPEIRK